MPPWWLGPAAGVLVFLAQPLTWGVTAAPWSVAPALLLALTAWFGWRCTLPAAVVAGLLAVLNAMAGPASEPPQPRVAWAAGAAVAGAVEALLGWWLYRWAGGARRPADPRSATLFVLLLPGLSAAVAALLRGGLAWLLDASGGAAWLAGLWLEHAIGLVTAAPLLLLLTDWLARRGLVAPEAAAASHPSRGDWVEVAVLAACAALLGVALAASGALGWPVWGVTLLLIVWAAVRQGAVGGTLVAAAVAAPLGLGAWPADATARLPVQAHLLAQGCVALLVAAGAAAARLHEAAYRQLAAHLPVVLYSARLTDPPVRSAPLAAELTLVSAASGRLMGCPPEQLLGDYARWQGRVHPDDREVLLAAVQQLIRQDQPVTCEYRLAEVAPPRWLRDTLAPRREGGRLVGWDGVVSDVSDQRALADDLLRTTGMFHALVGNLPAGVFFVQGPLGQPTLVNARARQLLGQREDATAGLDHLSRVYRLFRPDGTPYPAEELPVYLALRQGRTTMRDDIVAHRPDGRRVPLISWAAPVQVGSPAAAAAVWVLEDLTALRQAEAARQQSEGRLRTVIETMAEGLLVTDELGRIVSANPAACAFFAAPAEQLRGRNLLELDWEFRRQDGAALPAEEHPAVLAGRLGRPVRNVVLGLHPRRRSAAEAAPPLAVRWLLVNAMPLGVPGDVVVTFSDLSAYVHATEGVRVSEERYRGLVESLPIMLLQSDRQLRVTYANPATLAITGYTQAEIAEPADWASVIHPDDVGRLFEMAHAALAGRSDRAECRYRAKDGTEKVSFVLVQPRYQGAAVDGATTLIVDVTRERQLERELQQAQRLELVGRLAGGVAHDFNNLLNIVLNLTDLVRGDLPAGHAAHADLGRIAAAAEHATDLAQQLLALAKQRPAPPRRVDLNAVARRTLDLLRAALPATVRLEAELCPGELAVHADSTQLQQVLMNLCLNARDAMPDGGVLRVATARTEGEPAGVRLTVEDSGQGMSEEVRRRLFEPFFSTKEGGTGLGLAVVGQIVEGNGGRIELSSRPGAGTQFDIHWPMA